MHAAIGGVRGRTPCVPGSTASPAARAAFPSLYLTPLPPLTAFYTHTRAAFEGSGLLTCAMPRARKTQHVERIPIRYNAPQKQNFVLNPLWALWFLFSINYFRKKKKSRAVYRGTCSVTVRY